MKKLKSSLLSSTLGRKCHSTVTLAGERRTDVQETCYIFVALKAIVMTITFIHIFIPNTYNCDSLQLPNCSGMCVFVTVMEAHCHSDLSHTFLFLFWLKAQLHTTGAVSGMSPSNKSTIT